jgi:hypothetical protein
MKLLFSKTPGSVAAKLFRDVLSPVFQATPNASFQRICILYAIGHLLTKLVKRKGTEQWTTYLSD